MSESSSSMLFVPVCHTEDSLGPHGLVDPEPKPQTLASLPALPGPSGQEATHLACRPSSWATGFRPTCSAPGDVSISWDIGGAKDMAVH